MLVNLEVLHGVCVLRLEGRFATGQDAQYLRARTEEVCCQGCRKIVVDFSNVSYIDSTGIGFLISVYTTLRRDGEGQLVLAGTHDRVNQVLKLTRLDSVLVSYPDVPSAISAVGSDGLAVATQV